MYLDNAAFYEDIADYIKKYKEAELKGLPKPSISNRIGKCLLDIGRGLSLHKHFVRYSYKEDMISDGIETCVRYMHNYDLERKNPHAYFTKIMFYTFLRRIELERKESYIKNVSLYNSIIHDQNFELSESEKFVGDSSDLSFYEIAERISEYEYHKDRKNKKKLEKKKNESKHDS